MDNNCAKFIANFRNFLESLNRYVPNQACQKILENYEKLKMEKVIVRMYQTLQQYETEIKNRDSKMFYQDVILLAGLNLSTLWPQLSEKRQKKVWAYLNLLWVLSEMIVKSTMSTQPAPPASKKRALTRIEEEVNHPSETQASESETPDSEPALSFNPYVGIGGEAPSQEFGMEELFSGPESLPQEEGSGGVPGLGMLAGAAGLGSLNMDELRDELQNITDEDISSATEGLKGILGADGDEHTSDLFGSVIESITTELRGCDMADGNPFQNIVTVAQSVATKMHGKMSAEDMEHLVNSTTNMAQKYADDMGVGDQTDNPELLMQSLMAKMQEMSQDPPNSK